MSYVGIHTQQVQNNMKSILLLILFPCIVLGMVYAFLAITNMYEVPDGYQSSRFVVDTATANAAFLEALPWVVGIVGISAGMEGFAARKAAWWERILLIGGGLCLVVPETVTDIIGLVIVVGIFALQLVQNKILAKKAA